MTDTITETRNGTKDKPSTLFKILAPFIPIIIGSALKLSLFADVPKPKDARNAYLIAEYVRLLWLQLLISAYMLPIAAIMTQVEWPRRTMTALYLVPAGAFLICLFLVLGLPRLGAESNMLQIWLPDGLAALCTIILGAILTKES